MYFCFLGILPHSLFFSSFWGSAIRILGDDRAVVAVVAVACVVDDADVSVLHGQVGPFWQSF